MKKSILLLPAVLFLFSFANSIKQEGKDLCKAYIPLVKGAELEYQEFDAKDKLTSTQTMTIKDVVETATSLTVDVHSLIQGKKEDEKYESEYSYTCENGVFSVSLESMMSSESMEAYKDMEVKMEQENLAFPSNMKVGDKLEDAHLIMEVFSSGMKVMTMNFDIVDRIVEKEETITTDAGSFPCLKLSYTTKTKMGFMNIEAKTIEWLSPNVGPVRTETYDKKGKMESYRLLSKISL